MTPGRWRLVRRLSTIAFLGAWLAQGAVLVRGGDISGLYVLANGVYLAIRSGVNRLESRAPALRDEA